jgi:hypothetical protein
MASKGTPNRPFFFGSPSDTAAGNDTEQYQTRFPTENEGKNEMELALHSRSIFPAAMGETTRVINSQSTPGETAARSLDFTSISRFTRPMTSGCGIPSRLFPQLDDRKNIADYLSPISGSSKGCANATLPSTSRTANLENRSQKRCESQPILPSNEKNGNAFPFSSKSRQSEPSHSHREQEQRSEHVCDLEKDSTDHLGKLSEELQLLQKVPRRMSQILSGLQEEIAENVRFR